MAKTAINAALCAKLRYLYCFSIVNIDYKEISCFKALIAGERFDHYYVNPKASARDITKKNKTINK